MPDDGGVPARQGIFLPYYTRDRGDTEYLISNPGSATITGSLVIYGPECRPAGEPVGIRIGPNCTQSVLVRPIVAEHAGHAVLHANAPPAVSILYLRGDDQAIVGNALVDAPSTARPPARPAAKTYVFGYRTLPHGIDRLSCTLFVSNVHTSTLSGLLTAFGEECKSLGTKKFEVDPGCTIGIDLPPNHYGYGQVRVNAPAVLNLLHFSRNAGGLAAAELLGEGNLITEPPPPGTGLLIDYTHGCRGASTGDMGTWESALVTAGYQVDRLTTPPLTLAALQPYAAFAVIMPRTGYTSAETQAISDFVRGGGGLFVVQDYGVDPPVGPMPWSWPTRSVLGAFGLIDDNNMAQDQLHNTGGSGRVLFEASRCFKPHPIVAGLSAVLVDATCTFSMAAGWTTIVETDADASPANQPMLIEQRVGNGRVLVLGDSNILADSVIGNNDNQTFGVRCASRVLFKI